LKERFGAEVTEATSKLKEIGEVSPVIRSSAGLYLVKLTAREPAGHRPMEEVRDAISYWIQKERAAQAERNLRIASREGLTIQINRPLLDQINLPVVEPKPPGLPGERIPKERSP
jgi:peptidyl-prolyl cis-trans isomerase C